MNSTNRETLDHPLRFHVQGFETQWSPQQRSSLWFITLAFEGDPAAPFSPLWKISVPSDIGARLHSVFEAGKPLELREVLPSPPIEGVNRSALRELAYQAAREDLDEPHWSRAIVRLAAVASPRSVIAMLDEIERLERVVALGAGK